jgi:uncharacterized protein (DUF2252 family)
VASAQLLTPSERESAGRSARSKAPRKDHGNWEPAPKRPDPVKTLVDQDEARVPELVPIRHGRMLVSDFTFYRGAAAIMAADLAAIPSSGLNVQLCGDAHLSNFGAFMAPDRRLIFDINDFDETLPGPFEWDVKRLAASFEVAGRALGFKRGKRRELVASAVREYREEMRRLAAMRDIDVWYTRLGVEELERLRDQVSAKRARTMDKTLAKAERKNSLRAFSKLTRRDGGSLRIVNDPPLIVPVEDLVDDDTEAIEEKLVELINQYRSTLSGDIRLLADRYRYVHAAHKVVGVGSVGTRCWIVLLLGRDSDDPLFLQVKEAGRSVLEPYAAPSRFKNQGRRVVEGQRVMQAASDLFLGWLRAEGIDGRQRDFYVRQLWDGKASAEIDRMNAATLTIYARLCSWTLARAHARSGDRIAIAAYLGGGDSFDDAIAEFGEAYADQNERDYAAFAAAVESGRLQAQTGL